jgi:hypothetical protein
MVTILMLASFISTWLRIGVEGHRNPKTSATTRPVQADATSHIERYKSRAVLNPSCRVLRRKNEIGGRSLQNLD